MRAKWFRWICQEYYRTAIGRNRFLITIFKIRIVSGPATAHETCDLFQKYSSSRVLIFSALCVRCCVCSSDHSPRFFRIIVFVFDWNRYWICGKRCILGCESLANYFAIYALRNWAVSEIDIKSGCVYGSITLELFIVYDGNARHERKQKYDFGMDCDRKRIERKKANFRFQWVSGIARGANSISQLNAQAHRFCL